MSDRCWSCTVEPCRDSITGSVNLPTSMAKLLVAKMELKEFSPTPRIKFRQEKQTHGLRASHVTATAYVNKCLKIAKKGQEGLYYRKSSTIHTLGLSQTAEEGAKKRSQQYIASGAPMEEIQQLLESPAGQKWQICTKLNTSLWEIESYCSNGSQRYLPLQGQWFRNHVFDCCSDSPKTRWLHETCEK